MSAANSIELRMISPDLASTPVRGKSTPILIGPGEVAVGVEVVAPEGEEQPEKITNAAQINIANTKALRCQRRDASTALLSGRFLKVFYNKGWPVVMTPVEINYNY